MQDELNQMRFSFFVVVALKNSILFFFSSSLFALSQRLALIFPKSFSSL